jgi:hypothetical protein
MQASKDAKKDLLRGISSQISAPQATHEQVKDAGRVALDDLPLGRAVSMAGQEGALVVREGFCPSWAQFRWFLSFTLLFGHVPDHHATV